MKNSHMKNRKEMRKGLFWVTAECNREERAMSNTTFCPMPRWTLILSLSTIALLAVLPTMANAAPVVINGDFEDPDASMDPTYYAGESFGGWTVESGNVNHVNNDMVTPPWPGWQAASGSQSVDLTGQEAGTIYQDLSTLRQTYLLSFAMAGNPYGGPAVKTMEVWWDYTLVDIVTFDTTGYSNSNMGWIYYEYSVMASEPITRLKFKSLTDGVYGPALDDVSVTIPEPGTLLLLGLGGLVLRRIYRRGR